MRVAAQDLRLSGYPSRVDVGSAAGTGWRTAPDLRLSAHPGGLRVDASGVDVGSLPGSVRDQVADLRYSGRPTSVDVGSPVADMRVAAQDLRLSGYPSRVDVGSAAGTGWRTAPGLRLSAHPGGLRVDASGVDVGSLPGSVRDQVADLRYSARPTGVDVSTPVADMRVAAQDLRLSGYPSRVDVGSAAGTGWRTAPGLRLSAHPGGLRVDASGVDVGSLPGSVRDQVADLRNSARPTGVDVSTPVADMRVAAQDLRLSGYPSGVDVGSAAGTGWRTAPDLRLSAHPGGLRVDASGTAVGSLAGSVRDQVADLRYSARPTGVDVSTPVADMRVAAQDLRLSGYPSGVDVGSAAGTGWRTAPDLRLSAHPGGLRVDASGVDVSSLGGTVISPVPDLHYSAHPSDADLSALPPPGTVHQKLLSDSQSIRSDFGRGATPTLSRGGLEIPTDSVQMIGPDAVYSAHLPEAGIESYDSDRSALTQALNRGIRRDTDLSVMGSAASRPSSVVQTLPTGAFSTARPDADFSAPPEEVGIDRLDTDPRALTPALTQFGQLEAIDEGALSSTWQSGLSVPKDAISRHVGVDEGLPDRSVSAVRPDFGYPYPHTQRLPEESSGSRMDLTSSVPCGKPYLGRHCSFIGFWPQGPFGPFWCFTASPARSHGINSNVGHSYAGQIVEQSNDLELNALADTQEDNYCLCPAKILEALRSVNPRWEACPPCCIYPIMSPFSLSHNTCCCASFCPAIVGNRESGDGRTCECGCQNCCRGRRTIVAE
ncbi:uncharacterized protein LOC119657520 [Hermetia illucens]|uniref:uncharacterized protein LOC119657520 n=1 Tax=Hermetia illucens TaxID=343691 RepID=UPI0018CC0A07|nr:uncharacterized protein LOC119657520 [Hermetia illucens]